MAGARNVAPCVRSRTDEYEIEQSNSHFWPYRPFYFNNIHRARLASHVLIPHVRLIASRGPHAISASGSALLPASA